VGKAHGNSTWKAIIKAETLDLPNSYDFFLKFRGRKLVRYRTKALDGEARRGSTKYAKKNRGIVTPDWHKNHVETDALVRPTEQTSAGWRRA